VSELLDRLAQAPDGLLLMAALFTAAALYAAFTGLRRVRNIEDVPTARVRSAPQGYVELVGKAHSLDGEPIIAPLSRTACCWYRYRIEHRGEKGWRPVETGKSDGIFMLRDATGECIIDPDGAEVTTEHSQTWYDNGDGWGGGHGVHARLPSLGKTADAVVNVGGKLMSGLGGAGDYRYTEAVVLDGDPLYAIGWFHTVGPGERASTVRELTGAILREWKQRPDTLRERFDSNNDGRIDTDEWERARGAAEQAALEDYARQFGGKPLHTLKKPPDRRLFLLSNLPEFGLVRRYRWRMRLGFGAFLVLASALAVMISGRL
jgi:hypothetical protein